MTTVEMLNWFDLLQDKFGAPYYDVAHKLDFLNRAQFEYIKGLFPDNEGGRINVEYDWNVLQNVAPLVYELPPLTMSTSGTIPISTLVTQLQTLSGDTSADVYKLLSIEYKQGSKRFPCRVLRHNDKAAFEANYFKKPDYANPRYLLQNGNLQFRPIDDQTPIFITVLKTPRALSVSPAVDCELPVTTHNEIVALALQFAGIGTRDVLLANMNQMQVGQAL